MAQIIGIGSLGALLALTVALWHSAQPRPDVIAAANSSSLSISDVALTLHAKSLPQQQMEDRTFVFTGP